MKLRPPLLPVLVLLILAHPARGEEKSQYNLFNPTPREQMRELSADRPDLTESPYTVDAGHVQLEMSFLDFAYDDEDDVEVRTFTIAPLNLKLGLLNNADVQLVLDPYIHSRTDIPGARDQTEEGIGDTQLRLKVNLWGNDGGATALAVMPFVKFPTAANDLGNDEVEGGLIIPFATELPAGFSLGLMGEFDVVYDPADDDYTVEFLHTAAVGHDLVGDLAGYVEYIGIAPFDDGPYQTLVGLGLTYSVSDNVQLDGGVVIGLTDEVDDFNAFTGITIRL